MWIADQATAADRGWPGFEIRQKLPQAARVAPAFPQRLARRTVRGRFAEQGEHPLRDATEPAWIPKSVVKSCARAAPILESSMRISARTFQSCCHRFKKPALMRRSEEWLLFGSLIAHTSCAVEIERDVTE